MIRIGFFLENSPLGFIDYTNILQGNPGIGGSEFQVILNAYLLSLNPQYKVYLFAQTKSIFPKEIEIICEKDFKQCIHLCKKYEIKYFIFKEQPHWITDKCFQDIPLGINLIAWCHNFLSTKRLDFYAKHQSFKSIIMVGREQAELYRDHKAFTKIDYIYNGNIIPSQEEINSLIPCKNRKNIVTYIGSIYPYKGFHLLARAWKKVTRYVPDAELYVIGSADVYNVNSQKGKYNIALPNYEKVFMSYLTENGELMKNVHFMGKMGVEKNDILKQTKVGVPNPSGRTETFGISAIEMQMMGCCVVTKKCCGFLDTVINSNNLYSKNSSLAKYIIKNLKSPNFNNVTTYNAIKEKFGYKETIKEWEKLFENIELGNPKIHDFTHQIKNKKFNFKWLRLITQKINEHFNYILPPLIKWKEGKIYRKIDYLSDRDAFIKN